MRERHTAKSLLAVIKNLLRRRNVTYSQLALKLNRSESYIKKLFKKDDVSIETLNDLCDALNISLTDLLQSTEEKTHHYRILTLDEETYFIKNIKTYILLKNIVRFGNLKLLCEKLNINEQEGYKHIKQLEQMGFVQLQANGYIKLERYEGYEFVPDGPLSKLINKLRAINYIQYLYNNNFQSLNDQTRAFATVRLTSDLAKELNQRLHSIKDEFVERGSREAYLVGRENLNLYTMMLYQAPYDPTPDLTKFYFPSAKL